jgi:hypothetical protein
VSIKSIAEYHLTKGHPGIQYHYVVGPDGKVFQCNSDDRDIYHSYYWDTGIGVCLLGDFTTAKPTSAQLDATRELIYAIRDMHGKVPVVGHNTPRDGKAANTACPGATKGSWLPGLDVVVKPPAVETGPSLLGVFYQAVPSKEQVALVENSGIRYVKGLHMEEWQPEWFKDKIRISRPYIGSDSVEQGYIRQGARGAEEYFQVILPRLQLWKSWGVQYVSGPNEPPVDTDADMDLLVEFWVRLLYLIHTFGMKAVVLSFGVGWPHIDKAKKFMRVFEAMRDGDLFEVHEYGWPWVDSDLTWTSGRIRRTLDELYAAGLQKKSYPWVLIGEKGVDGGLADKPEVGWVGNIPEDVFWSQMSAMDDWYMKNVPEVAAVTPFVSNPFEKWKTFDWNENLIKRSIAKIGTVVPPVAPPVVPPVVVTPDPFADLNLRLEVLEKMLKNMSPVSAFGYEVLGRKT